MVDTCHEFGIEPIVTLMHFTVPRWFERDGFWRAADAADLFARYTEAALPVVHDGVRYVCTINEPNIAAMLAGGEDAANLVAYGLPNPDLRRGRRPAGQRTSGRARCSSQVSGLQSGWTIATQAFKSTGEPGADEMLRELRLPARRLVPRERPPATTSSACRPTPAPSSARTARCPSPTTSRRR